MKQFVRHKFTKIALLLSIFLLLISLLTSVFYNIYSLMGLGFMDMLFELGSYDTPTELSVLAVFQIFDIVFYGIFALTSLSLAAIPFVKTNSTVPKISILCSTVISTLFFLIQAAKSLIYTSNAHYCLVLFFDLFPCICFVLIHITCLNSKKKPNFFIKRLWPMPSVLMLFAAASKLFLLSKPDSLKISSMVFQTIGMMCAHNFFVYLSLSAVMLFLALLLKKERTAEFIPHLDAYHE